MEIAILIVVLLILLLLMGLILMVGFVIWHPEEAPDETPRTQWKDPFDINGPDVI